MLYVLIDSDLSIKPDIETTKGKVFIFLFGLCLTVSGIAYGYWKFGW